MNQPNTPTEKQKNNPRAKDLAGAAVAGAVIGAAAAYVSRKENREKVVDAATKLGGKAQETLEQVQQKSTQLKDSVSTLLDDKATHVGEAADELKTGARRAVKQLNETDQPS